MGLSDPSFLRNKSRQLSLHHYYSKIFPVPLQIIKNPYQVYHLIYPEFQFVSYEFVSPLASHLINHSPFRPSPLL